MRVGVASDLSLVAETICAALGSRSLDASLVTWQDPGATDEPTVWWTPSTEGGRSGPDMILLVCDVSTPSRLDQALDRGRRCAVPWVVMAESPRGPAWGAVLEAGARAVVPSTISLSELVEVLDAVLRDEAPMGVVERVGLLHEWWAARDDRERLRERMSTLSPREQEVLSMLYEGTTVRAIADRLGVSEATVRSQVKSVLRKLSVDSQLGAVAAMGELREDEDPR
jgi:RNA polymerase sigma factor (sigma-70 family)